MAAMPICVTPMDMKRVLSAGENVLVDLKIRDGEELQTRLVMVKECVYQPRTGLLSHVDLYEISLQDAIRVDVPLAFTGEAEGVVVGGVLSPLLRSLEVSCLPERIPHEIAVDCTGLKIGGMIYVRDIPIPEEIEVLTDESAAVVTVTEPGALAERAVVEEREEEAAEAETAEEGSEK
jgi:large subunit ribosomal protein L25